MDILNGIEAKRINKIRKEMVEAISSLPIDRADVQRAEEFFDFSKDMDLSILENVGHYEFENLFGNACINLMYKIEKEDEKE